MVVCVRLKRLKDQTSDLINSLSSFARVNKFGFIETPYRRVDPETGKSNMHILIILLQMKKIVMYVAQANAKLTEDGYFAEEEVVTAFSWMKTQIVPREKVDYMDVSPKQVVSAATACIPFLGKR